MYTKVLCVVLLVVAVAFPWPMQGNASQMPKVEGLQSLTIQTMPAWVGIFCPDRTEIFMPTITVMNMRQVHVEPNCSGTRPLRITCDSASVAAVIGFVQNDGVLLHISCRSPEDAKKRVAPFRARLHNYDCPAMTERPSIVMNWTTIEQLSFKDDCQAAGQERNPLVRCQNGTFPTFDLIGTDRTSWSLDFACQTPAQTAVWLTGAPRPGDPGVI